MTPVILSRDNPNHLFHIQQWNEAVTTYNALLDWVSANPRPDTFNAELGSPVWDQYRQWANAQTIEEQRLGLNITLGSDDYEKGRIIPNRRFGANILRLRKLTRDINDKPTIGDRVVQCPHCKTLFSTFSQHDHYCSDTCNEQAKAQRATAKAERRKDRQSQRSAALANRTGTCLACGEDFTLKRITAKTCSETCRKRLQRKPELADLHLEFPPLRKDIKELEVELTAASAAQMNASIQAIQTGQHSEDTTKEQRIELKGTIWTQRCRQRLRAMASDAPALTAWLCKQSDDTLRAAFSPEYSATILGPDLKSKLGIDQYTDAEVSWGVRFGMG